MQIIQSYAKSLNYNNPRANVIGYANDSVSLCDQKHIWFSGHIRIWKETLSMYV